MHGPGRRKIEEGLRGGRQDCLPVLRSKNSISFYISASFHLQDISPIFSMVLLIIIQLIRCSLTHARKLRGVAWGRAQTGSTVGKDVLLFRHTETPRFLLPVYLIRNPRAEIVYHEALSALRREE